jgi:RsmE family RNA methyltransferase
LNLLLVEPGEIDPGGRVRLTGRRAQHLLGVLKVEPGREVRAGVVDGGPGTGTVEAVEGDVVVLRLEWEEAPEQAPTVDLVVALPRPQALHRLLQWSATFGVGRLDLVRSWRVEKSFFSSPSVSPEGLRKHLLLGAEQGSRTRLPRVELHHRLLPFLETMAAEDDGGRRFLAHPEAPLPIEEGWRKADAVGRGRRTRIAIGPEGGWLDREVESFARCGFEAITLGPWVLRVETAVAAAVAQVELLRRSRNG